MNIIYKMFYKLLLIEFIFIQCLVPIGSEAPTDLSEVMDWNPFDTTDGNTYKYVPNNGIHNIGRKYFATDDNKTVNPLISTTTAYSSTTTNGSIDTSAKRQPNITGSNVTQSTDRNETDVWTDSTTDVYQLFNNVPQKFRYKCLEDSYSNSVHVAGELASGRYCVFFDVVIACLAKTARSNPLVDYLRDPDPRYINSNLNSALLMGNETHIFSYFSVCSFFENQRIRCQQKEREFPALAHIIPTSSFSFTDPKDKSRWILVVDNRSLVGGQESNSRHYIENGRKLLKRMDMDYNIDASVVLERRRYSVDGYSFVGQSYYKFTYLTKTNFSVKNEISRQLWGKNQEFIGCPKPICHASVVDTVIKLKDNITYVFVGKYYWNLTDGLSVSKAIFIDAIDPFETQFPYLFSDIDCSFYDTHSDEAYFLKESYVYSYVKTEVFPPHRTTPQMFGQHISKVFPGLAPNMNAAFYYRPNSTVYFFRRYHYWAYDLRRKQVLSGYPRLVTDFENMPPNVDSILSNNFGTYYVFFGTFYATFTENQFKIGLKLEFKVSNVDFFRCDKQYFNNYLEYKREMETTFPPIPAKTILDLTNNEGMDLSAPEFDPSLQQKGSTLERRQESFLTTFANLILFGPFFYQIFTDESYKPIKSKSMGIEIDEN